MNNPENHGLTLPLEQQAIRDKLFSSVGNVRRVSDRRYRDLDY